MSKYTTRQILDMIEEHGGPEGLDLSGADLIGIDLSEEAIQAELEKTRKEDPEAEPAWLSEWGGINLAGANLRGADLSGTKLQGAWLWRADLREALLDSANLRDARLWGANLEGAALWSAELDGVDLWGASLRRVDFAGAQVQGADFGATNLQWALFGGANLQRATFLDANLQRASFAGADLRGADFHGAHLDHTEIDKGSLGPAVKQEVDQEYTAARYAYLRLKQNFDDLGDYAASAWAYQKERQMEKQCNAPWRARNIYGLAELGENALRARVCLFYARHTVKWILDWIVEYLCGYGESIGKVLFWMAASLIVSATYYWHIGGVWLVDPGKGPIATATSFGHYLIYSLGAFTTTQFATLEPADDRVRLITGIQAILGIFLAGLLGFVVANKIRRS